MATNNTTNQSGFTLVELLVSVALLVMMSMLGYIAVTNLRNTTNTNIATEKLVTDIRGQQLIAMLGKSSSATSTDVIKPQGVYFSLNTNTYVMFECSSQYNCIYNPAAATNVTNRLDGSMIFYAVNLPGNQVVFQPNSGEIQNYNSTSQSVTVRNTANNSTKTINFTQFGKMTVQ